VEALRRQIASEREARGAEQEASGVAAEEARANARQAEAPASYNAQEQERLRQLRAEGLIAERDYQRGRTAAQQANFAAEREHIAVRRIEQEQRTRESDRESRIRALEAEIVRLEGTMATSRAALGRLENEIARRVVRAPADGKLGETAALRVGAVLHEGDRVAALVPDGRLIVVAQFPPAAALGRIAPGQLAVLRLDGFPWLQYGPVKAQVARVASEVRDGTVRVEMAVDTSGSARVPLQHGLPGSVEVQVERVTPAALILRTAGRMMASSRSAYGQP
jgi:membrane fusion protein (multidrug efflux system)